MTKKKKSETKVVAVKAEDKEVKPTAQEVANTCLGMTEKEAEDYIANEVGYKVKKIDEDSRTVVIVIKNGVVFDAWTEE